VPIFLPVVGRSLSLITLTSIGVSIGLLSGLFGVGGGFLLTPVLMMIGVPATVAAASGSCQMVATSSSGVAAHFRLGNVDVKMGSVLLLGGLAGAALGVQVIRDLHTLGEATLAITLAYVVVLGGLGSFMFFQSLRTLRRGAILPESVRIPRKDGLLRRLPWQMEFPDSRVRHSILIPIALASLVGVLASIMGVGGGFIMLPMMVYLLGMPTHVAVGTSLFQILFLCAGVTYMQAATNHTVDLILVLPLAASSAVGAQIGARLSRLLRGAQLMILLAILVLLVTGEMMTGLIFTPSNLLRPTDTGPPPGVTRRARVAPQSKLVLDGNSIHQAAESPLLAHRFYEAGSRRHLLLTKHAAEDRVQPRRFSTMVGVQIAMPGMDGKKAHPTTEAFSASADERRAINPPTSHLEFKMAARRGHVWKVTPRSMNWRNSSVWPRRYPASST